MSQRWREEEREIGEGDEACIPISTSNDNAPSHSSQFKFPLMGLSET